MASAIGPNRDGPENVFSSSNLCNSSTSIVATNLKILAMALARDLDVGTLMSYVPQKSRMSAQVGRNDLSSNRSANASAAVRRSVERSIFATYSGAVVLVLLR